MNGFQCGLVPRVGADEADSVVSLNIVPSQISSRPLNNMSRFELVDLNQLNSQVTPL